MILICKIVKLNDFDCNLFIKDKFINDHYECNITDFDNNVIKDNPENRNYLMESIFLHVQELLDDNEIDSIDAFEMRINLI